MGVCTREAPGGWRSCTQHTLPSLCRCCEGRVVSVLEGGYNLRGGLVSAFARSVAAHVRALADVHTQAWDPAEPEVSRGLGGLLWGLGN